MKIWPPAFKSDQLEHFIFLSFCVLVSCLPFSIALLEISVVVILILWVAYRLRLGFERQGRLSWSGVFKFLIPEKTPLDGAIVLFALVNFASAIYSVARGFDLMLNVRGILKVGEWFLIYYVAAEIFKNPRRTRPMMLLIIASLMVMCLDGLFQVIFGYDFIRHFARREPYPIPRMRGPFTAENSFSSYLLLLFPAIFFYGTHVLSTLPRVRERLRLSFLFGLGQLFILFCLIQTKSRAAWLGLIFGFAVVGQRLGKKKIPKFVWLVLLAFLLLPALLNIYNAKVAQMDRDRYTSLKDETLFNYNFEDLGDRPNFWYVALEIIVANPLLGVGPNCYNAAVKRHLHLPEGEGYPYPHNSYLRVSAELGIIGLLSFLTLLFTLVRTMDRQIVFYHPKSMTSSILAGTTVSIMALIAKAYLDTDFNTMQLVDLFWFVAGFSVGLIKIHEAENPLVRQSAKKSVKIAHVANRQSIRHLIMPHIRRQLAEGNEVVAITSRGNLEIHQEGLVLESLVFEEQRIRFFADILAFFRLTAALRKHSPDIVHTHNVKFGVMGRWAARLAGIKYVVHTVHGIYEPFNATNFHRRLIFFIEKMSNRLCDALAFVSRFNLHTYLQKKIADPNKCIYIGNGIDLLRFNPKQYSASEVLEKRRELGIPKDATVVGMVGRLVTDKGYYEFFEAARDLAQKIPNLFFLVIALSYHRDDSVSEDVAARFGVADKTIFLYDRTDMPLLYLVMDVLLHPSWREGFPRSLMEASAMGRACIASDIEGNRNVIEPDITGVLTPVKNSKALTEACLRLLENKASAKKMAENASSKARLSFDQEKMFDGLEQVYCFFLLPKGIERLKQTLDYFLAAGFLLLTAPLFILLAVAVRLDSRGPIFFIQQRVGKNGIIFSMIKFRTFDEGRITRLGKFLRPLGLDEIPQIFNVLKGEMSFVGPRPSLPEQIQRYTAFQRNRLAVKPGLTGLVAVSGGYSLSWRRRIRLDIWYARHRTLLMDFFILLRTFPLLLFRRSPLPESDFSENLVKV